jgi:2',3'-cyclic-nucleotide 2'-phosphodiesterase (5'-nucleotidase family)
MPKAPNLLLVCILPLLLTIHACQSPDQGKAVEGELIRVDSIAVPIPDAATDSIIALYRSSLEAEMNQVLAHSAQLMRKGTPEDLLNNFIADLVLEKGQEHYEPGDGMPIDFCVLNYGGLRTSIPEGPVTRSRIFEVMPFENEMVVLTLSAEKTWEVFEYIASRNVGTPISGITVGVRDRQPAEVLVQGQAFDPDRTYKVLTSDYLAGSGDNMSFFADPLNTEVLGLRIRDAIILHLEEQDALGRKVSSRLDGRLYYMD